ncbi:hypothetical protein IJ750_05480 [bacterium]|nr:hypothetical protein [bacterium]
MDIQPIQLFNFNKKFFNGEKPSNFKGRPEKIGYASIRGWEDAIKHWEMLKNAKFLDVHSDKEFPYYKSIREDNYSFLEKLKSYTDKSEFIQRFCAFTGFPNLREVSTKIDSTFTECAQNAARSLNYTTYGYPYKIVDSGYDPTCSVGLKKAFPGSDLDKGYVIIEGGSPYISDNDAINIFKGKLWETLDQRIVSLNHPETAIEVQTVPQIKSKIQKLDEITKNFLDKGLNTIGAATGAVIGNLLLGPFGVPLGLAFGALINSGMTDKYIKIKASDETNPYWAGEFNREIAKQLNSSEERENAKNFAFFIETVEANLKLNSKGKYADIFTMIKESPFVLNSNVTQIAAWLERINGGYLKTKLRNREKLEKDFKSMATNEKYELVKDVIKSSSNDQSSKFSKYFKNDDDIKGRYDRLLDALR